MPRLTKTSRYNDLPAKVKGAVKGAAKGARQGAKAGAAASAASGAAAGSIGAAAAMAGAAATGALVGAASTMEPDSLVIESKAGAKPAQQISLDSNLPLPKTEHLNALSEAAKVLSPSYRAATTLAELASQIYERMQEAQ